MKNIKDITLSIFAVIGFVALLSSFTNQSQSEVTNGTTESHKFEIYMMDTGETHYIWLLTKETGKVWRLRKNGEQLGMTVRDTK